MSLSFCVLASGSAGNSAVVMCNGDGRRRCMLIDAGLSPRRTCRRLAELGLSIDDVGHILITHFDTDHFHRGWLRRIAKGLRATFHVHHRHRMAACRAGLTMRHARLCQDAAELDQPDVNVRTILLAHDDLGSMGFIIEHAGLRLGYATDLGRSHEAMLDAFIDLNALAIESNYDRKMQMESGRPPFLKRRIMGGNGHLSNEQSLQAVLQIESQSALSQVVLLHLSRECNCPKALRALYRKRAPHLLDRLTITDQFQPTAMLEVKRMAPLCAQSQRAAPPLLRSPFILAG